MIARCRTCRGQVEIEQIGSEPTRPAYWCSHCRTVDLAPLLAASDYPRSSDDREGAA